MPAKTWLRIALPPLFAIALLLPAICGCSRNSQAKPISSGPQMDRVIRFQYAVYVLPGQSKAPLTFARQIVAKNYPDLKLVDDPPKEPVDSFVSVRLLENVRRDYKPPDIDTLHYFGHGLTTDQSQALQQSDQAILVEFTHPKEKVWTALRSANTLLEDLTRQTGGLAWDEETREVFSADAWHARRIASWPNDNSVPDVATQTTIHVYESGELLRAISLGMSKMGLPDAVVEEVSRNSDNQAGNLVNLLCQVMAEGSSLDPASRFKLELSAIKNAAARERISATLKPQADAFGILTLAEGRHDEGDPNNRLIQIKFDAYLGNDRHAQQERAISCFFGTEDSAVDVHHSAELLEASRKAKEKLPDLRKKFNAGLAPGESIMLKAPFSLPDGGNEWMWVEVTRWHGNQVQGLLQNDPVQIRNLHAGQIVDLQQDDVFDFIHRFPDGHMEGNATGDIISKQQQSVGRKSVPTPAPDCTTS